MPRGPNAFKHRDVVRALRAARAAGIDVARFEIAKDGTIIVVTRKSVTQDSGSLDQWIAEDAR
jgi:hypothetical protein